MPENKFKLTEKEKELLEERISICTADGIEEGTALLIAREQIETNRNEEKCR